MRSLSVSRLMALALLCGLLLAVPSLRSARAKDKVPAKGKASASWAQQKSGWTGHGVGSVVHRKTTHYMTGHKLETEEKKTLVEITEKHFVLKVERKNMLGWKTTTEKEQKRTPIDLSKAVPVEAGDETLTISGKSYPCRKLEAKDVAALIPSDMKPPTARRGRPGAGLTGAGAVWVHETLGPLKVEMTTKLGEREAKTTLLVSRLGVVKMIGAQKVSCRETKISNSLMPGSFLQLSSEHVPGRMVRSEMSFDGGGLKMGRVEELIAWVKKAPVPPTAR